MLPGAARAPAPGGCLTNWPALTIAAGDTPTGDSTVTGTLGTIVRADNGATQVTYNGLPLYFFAKDVAPGDTNGIYPNWEAVVLAAPVTTQAVAGRVIGSHGTLMVAASNGMTVYTFTKDVAGSGTSACTGGCLTNWPALTVAAGATPTGDASVTGQLGTIVRCGQRRDPGDLQRPAPVLLLQGHGTRRHQRHLPELGGRGAGRSGHAGADRGDRHAAARPPPSVPTGRRPRRATWRWLAIALAAGLSALLVVTRTAGSRR